MLSSDEYQMLDIPLTAEEIAERKRELGENTAVIQLVKEKVAYAQDQLETEYEIPSKKEVNKKLAKEINSKTQSLKLKVYSVANAEEKTMDIYSSIDQKHYKTGDLIMSRPMTQSEVFQFAMPSAPWRPILQ